MHKLTSLCRNYPGRSRVIQLVINITITSVLLVASGPDFARSCVLVSYKFLYNLGSMSALLTLLHSTRLFPAGAGELNPAFPRRTN